MSGNEEGKGRVALMRKIGTKILIEAAKKVTGYEIVEDIYDTVAEELRDIYQGAKKDKIYNFYMGIDELSEGEIVLSSDNFAFLIQKLMEDDEAGKAKIYSRLVVNIAGSSYEDEDRINFISILSKLSSYELELAKKYYIYGNYDLVGYEYRYNQLETLHEPTGGQLLRYTNGLVFNGLIYNANNRASQKGYYINTDTLNQFVLLIFDESELKVESIGEKEKERFDVIINSGINVGDCFDFLETELKVKGLAVHRCNNLILDENNLMAGLYVNAIKYDEYYHIGYSDSIEFGKYYDSAKALGSEKIPLVNHNEELSYLAEQILKALSE